MRYKLDLYTCIPIALGEHSYHGSAALNSIAENHAKECKEDIHISKMSITHSKFINYRSFSCSCRVLSPNSISSPHTHLSVRETIFSNNESEYKISNVLTPVLSYREYFLACIDSLFRAGGELVALLPRMLYQILV